MAQPTSGKAGYAEGQSPADGRGAIPRATPNPATMYFTERNDTTLSDRANEPNRERFPALLAKSEKYYNETLYPIMKNYPKAEKYSLCQDTKRACSDMLHAIVMANNLSSRKRVLECLERADAQKNLLLVYLKTANCQRYITNKMLAYQQGQVKEIGSLIGGAQRYIREYNTRAPA